MRGPSGALLKGHESLRGLYLRDLITSQSAPPNTALGGKEPRRTVGTHVQPAAGICMRSGRHPRSGSRHEWHQLLRALLPDTLAGAGEQHPSILHSHGWEWRREAESEAGGAAPLSPSSLRGQRYRKGDRHLRATQRQPVATSGTRWREALSCRHRPRI